MAGSVKRTLSALLPDRGLMHAQALDHYFFGEDEIRLLPVLCARGRGAVDAGANIGTYSYFLRHRASRVHAYEPNPGLAQRLARLLPGVNVRNVALSDADGEVILKVPLDEAGHQRHELASIAQSFEDERCADFHVAAITIDSEAHEDIGFIKIDVEQHERAVLRGALATIRRCRPVLMTEVAPLKYEAPLPEVFAFVLDEGYAGWFKFGGRWLPFEQWRAEVHARAESFGTPGAFMGNNVVFFPSEHPRAGRGPG